MEKKKCVLKFKQETTENGNVVRVANIAGTLKRLSEKVFDYTNAEGTVISYKLATMSTTRPTIGGKKQRENNNENDEECRC